PNLIDDTAISNAVSWVMGSGYYPHLVLNYIWLALILLAVVIGGFSQKMKEVADGAIGGAGSAVTLAIGLVGVMTLWLGMMRLAERAGLVQSLARLLRPLMRRLFPDVPTEHPAMGAMVL